MSNRPYLRPVRDVEGAISVDAFPRNRVLITEANIHALRPLVEVLARTANRLSQQPVAEEEKQAS